VYDSIFGHPSNLLFNANNTVIQNDFDSFHHHNFPHFMMGIPSNHFFGNEMNSESTSVNRNISSSSSDAEII
jgi:hypothetical protein